MADRAGVAVVGGGVVGTSVLFHLAERGCTDAVLLEKGQLGAGSTSRAAGGVRHLFSHPLNVETGKRNLQFFREFEERVGQPLDTEETGYAYLYHSGEVAAEWETRRDRFTDLGVDARMLGPEAVADLFPPLDEATVDGAFFAPECLHVDPHSVTQGYATAAREMGATIETKTAVEAVETDGKGLAVETETGRWEVDRVVNAAGPWAPALAADLGIDLPVELFARRIAVTSPLDAPASPLLVDGERNCYFRTEGNGSMLCCDLDGDVRGVEDPAEIGHGSVGYDYYLGALGKVAGMVPSVEDSEVINGWAGVQVETPDGHPVLGPTRVDGYLLATGFNGCGVMQSPAVGRALAEYAVEGETDVLPLDDLSVARFDDPDPIEPETMA